MKKKSNKAAIIVIVSAWVFLAFVITAFWKPGFLVKKKKNDEKSKASIETDQRKTEEAGSTEIVETEKEENKGTGDGGWTVMVYLCGSDLESGGGYATYNIKEMFQANLGTNVNLLLETGGSKAWETSGIDSNANQRFKVEGGSLVKLDSLPEASMGDAGTLSDFVTWGMTTYPADHFMLVIWDHGSEPHAGVAFDEKYDYDSLSMDELRQAMGNLPMKLDIIGFDTCLMASVETVSAVKNGAKLMVASEETIPGPGWSYDGFLNYISGNAGATPEDVSRGICDTYEEKCRSLGLESGITLSVTNLAYADAVEQAFAEMGSYLYSSLYDMDAYSQLQQAMASADSYGWGKTSSGEMYTNLVDMGDFAWLSGELLGMAGAHIQDVLNSCILYQVKGVSHAGATGLLFYSPQYTSSTCLDNYAAAVDDIAGSYYYLAYIDQLYDSWTLPSWVPQTEVPPPPEIATEATEAVTEAQTTEAPTEAPTTEAMTEAPTTEATTAPTTEAPTTEAPPTEAPTTELATDVPQGLENNTTEPGDNGNMVTSQNASPEIEPFVNGANQLELNIKSGKELIARADYYLYEIRNINGYETWFYWGSDRDVEKKENGYAKTPDRKGFMMDGHPFEMSLLRENEHCRVYIAPINLNGKDTWLYVLYDDTNGYRSMYVSSGYSEETKAYARDAVQLKEGDTIILQAHIMVEGYATTRMNLDTITYGKDTKIVKDVLPEQNTLYYYTFNLMDVFGFAIKPDGCYVTVKDGKITSVSMQRP